MRIGKWIAMVAAGAAVSALSGSLSLYADDTHDGLKLTPLMQQAFPDLPGKEGLVLTVEFGPGYVDPPHRHGAHVFVYVLEGSIEMQVAGGEPTTLNAGDTFYENPEDVHPVGRNLSKTKPAKLLVFFVKDQNIPPVLPTAK